MELQKNWGVKLSKESHGSDPGTLCLSFPSFALPKFCRMREVFLDPFPEEKCQILMEH